MPARYPTNDPSGHTRTSADVCDTTASPREADMTGSPRDVAEGPILLQNSKVAGPQIFRKKTEREVVADSYNLNRITKSPVSLSQGDEVPHIFTRKPRPRPAEFSVTSAKRLLQQNRPIATLRRKFRAAMLRKRRKASQHTARMRRLRIGERIAPSQWRAAKVTAR